MVFDFKRLSPREAGNCMRPQTAVKLWRCPATKVFSRLADESVWAKVLNLGGFDVLMTPFEPEDVLRVAFSAWSRWERGFAASTAKEAEAADRRRMSAVSD
jgi:hypothetical protein